MPGDRKKPIDGKIIVKYGELCGEGVLAGLTIAQARELIAREAPQLGLPADAIARITTMDDQAEAWTKIGAKQEDSIVTLSTDWGLQMFQGVSKDVPEDYVIRKEDIYLGFRDRA
ncbi:MAG TPA: hypothetical protein VLC10_00095 [Patescibacteria group bacterium]|nr:hypothetical protein [Patescibacteria group bacterium]